MVNYLQDSHKDFKIDENLYRILHRALSNAKQNLEFMQRKDKRLSKSSSTPLIQILGLPIVPNEVVRRQRHAREWFLRFQRNVFEYTVEQTLRERDEAEAAASGRGEVLAAAEAVAAGRAAAEWAAGGFARDPAGTEHSTRLGSRGLDMSCESC